jgi:Flp pilus assembly protein TadB
MNIQLLIIIASVVVVGGLGALALVLMGGASSGGRSNEMRELMSSGTPTDSAPGRAGAQQAFDLDGEDFKKRQMSGKNKKGDDISTKLFKAGFFTAEDRRKFLRMRIISFVVFLILVPLAFFLVTRKADFTFVVSIFLGAIVGITMPMSWLEKQIRKRADEVLYYLPLVIEQVSIGVSSALDVGPCISYIVEMTNERDSHNAVTEMFVHVEKLIKSGLSLQDSLVEVGTANGTNEVKHAFMFLAQCAKHGGEVSKQLQELADSVMTQRQVHIEGKIAALPVKATGPLAMVFAGFFGLLFAGLFVRLLSAFGS